MKADRTEANLFPQLDSQSLCGTHHCIGTAHSVVDIVFRNLHAKCASQGGSLTDADLRIVHDNLLKVFPEIFDFFESIHQRCMNASGVFDSKPLAPDRILSTLLFVCSQGSAVSVFSNEIERLGMNWLSLFYAAFSKSIQLRVGIDVERRLTSAYAEAAGKFRQKMSIMQLLSEQNVQNILRECAFLVVKLHGSSDVAAQLTAEINDYIVTKGGNLGRHLVTNDQIGRFLRLFPHDVYIVLKQATSAELVNLPSLWLQQLNVAQSHNR